MAFNASRGHTHEKHHVRISALRMNDRMSLRYGYMLRILYIYITIETEKNKTKRVVFSNSLAPKRSLSYR